MPFLVAHGLYSKSCEPSLHRTLLLQNNHRDSASLTSNLAWSPGIGHSAFTCSLAVAVGFVEGFTSSIFFVSAGFAVIVVRDAFGVRRAVDSLTKTVNDIIRKKKVGIGEIMKITGHTPIQAAVGVLLGIVVSVLFHFLVF